MEFFYIKRIDELLPLALTELPAGYGKTGASGPVIVTPPSSTPPAPTTA